MAKRKIIQTQQELPQTTPVLDRLSIEPGTKIRFRKHPDQHWQEGVVRGDNADGSLKIFDKRGSARSIMPENVQKKLQGPRGGTLWEDL